MSLRSDTLNSVSTSNMSAMNALPEYINHRDQDLSVNELNKRLEAVRAAKFQSIYVKDFEDNLACEEKLLMLLSQKQENNQGWNNPFMVGFSKLAVVLVLILAVCFWGSFILDKLMANNDTVLSSEPSSSQTFQLVAKHTSVKSS